MSLIIHQCFFTVIEGKKKGIGGKIKKVGGDIKKGANKAVDAVEDTAENIAKKVEDKANKIGKGFKALLNLKFIKFAKQLFTKEFLKKE
jgi:hypothetical protein